MDEWIRSRGTDEERQALVTQLQSLPTTTDEALDMLAALRASIIGADQTYEQIRLHQGAADSIKLMWRANQTVREEFDFTFLAGEWRIGQELLREEQEGMESVGGRPKTGFLREQVSAPTIAEKVGNRTYGWRLKTLAPLPLEALKDKIRDLHARDQEATLTGVVKILKAEESAMRRMDSMTAPVIYVPERRIGDSREMFGDIEPGSIPLVMTDPPYEDGGEPLWRWLGPWANEVLMPGGSFICYFGHHNVNKMHRILGDAGLTHFWACVMMHEQAQRLPGKFVIVGHKPILWYVKDFRRGRTLVPDVVYSTRRNKSEHAWGQGQGGITEWIHQLTKPGELILDPFCGSGQWGDIVCREGRRWIGCDIVKGGTTRVVADEEAAD